MGAPSMIDLPNEILRLVLIHAVESRSLARGLQLRLVCKLFANEVPPAVVASKVFETTCSASYVATRAAHERYILPYFTRIVLAGWRLRPSGNCYIIKRVHEIADAFLAIHEAPSWTRRECIERLCPLIEPPCMRSWKILRPRGVIGIGVNVDVFVAAAALGLTSIVRRTVDGIFGVYSSLVSSELFGSPLSGAAKGGHLETLQLLVRKAYHCTQPPPMPSLEFLLQNDALPSLDDRGYAGAFGYSLVPQATSLTVHKRLFEFYKERGCAKAFLALQIRRGLWSHAIRENRFDIVQWTLEVIFAPEDRTASRQPTKPSPFDGFDVVTPEMWRADSSRDLAIAKAVNKAKGAGLESMLELLRTEGVDIDRLHGRAAPRLKLCAECSLREGNRRPAEA